MKVSLINFDRVCFIHQRRPEQTYAYHNKNNYSKRNCHAIEEWEIRENAVCPGGKKFQNSGYWDSKQTSN